MWSRTARVSESGAVVVCFYPWKVPWGSLDCSHGLTKRICAKDIVRYREGTIYGSFVGAILIGIIEAGIVTAGLVGFWTRLVHGLVILVSVSAYALMAKRRRG